MSDIRFVPTCWFRAATAHDDENDWAKVADKSRNSLGKLHIIRAETTMRLLACEDVPDKIYSSESESGRWSKKNFRSYVGVWVCLSFFSFS